MVVSVAANDGSYAMACFIGWTLTARMTGDGQICECDSVGSG
jgi:hypothetical protein